ALAADPSAEKRQRLQTLLGRLDGITPTRLRYIRVMEILDRIGTPEAIQVIERLTPGNPDSFATAESRAVLARRNTKVAPPAEPPVEIADEAERMPPSGPVLPDRDGDPMPAGAIARLGTTRWRSAEEPRRIEVSPDGKTLAVIGRSSVLEFFDAS